MAVSRNFAPPNFIAPSGMIWEMLIGLIVIFAFSGDRLVGACSAAKGQARPGAQKCIRGLRPEELSHGVVMTDAQKRIVFCNNRYLESTGLPLGYSKNMTGPDCGTRRQPGVSISASTTSIGSPLPGRLHQPTAGGPRFCQIFRLPNVAPSPPRRLHRAARALAAVGSTKPFLESVLHNVPVFVAAKSIRGRPLHFRPPRLRTLLRFFRQDRPKERPRIFNALTTASIEAADQAALELARRPVPQRAQGRARRAEARSVERPRGRS